MKKLIIFLCIAITVGLCGCSGKNSNYSMVYMSYTAEENTQEISEMLSNRLDEMGYKGSSVDVEGTELIVSANCDVTEDVLRPILSLKGEFSISSDGYDTIVTKDDIKAVKAVDNNIEITFTESGQKKLYEISKYAVENNIPMIVEIDNVSSSLLVNEELNTDTMMISTLGTEALTSTTAKLYSAILNTEILPSEIK